MQHSVSSSVLEVSLAFERKTSATQHNSPVLPPWEDVRPAQNGRRSIKMILYFGPDQRIYALPNEHRLLPPLFPKTYYRSPVSNAFLLPKLTSFKAAIKIIANLRSV